jgi:hypothetical protein
MGDDDESSCCALSDDYNDDDDDADYMDDSYNEDEGDEEDEEEEDAEHKAEEVESEDAPWTSILPVPLHDIAYRAFNSPQFSQLINAAMGEPGEGRDVLVLMDEEAAVSRRQSRLYGHVVLQGTAAQVARGRRAVGLVVDAGFQHNPVYEVLSKVAAALDIAGWPSDTAPTLLVQPAEDAGESDMDEDDNDEEEDEEGDEDEKGKKEDQDDDDDNSHPVKEEEVVEVEEEEEDDSRMADASAYRPLSSMETGLIPAAAAASVVTRSRWREGGGRYTVSV